MGGDAKNIPLNHLGLPSTLLTKLYPIEDTRGLRALAPRVLATEWKITQAQFEKISLALTSRGYGPLKPWEAPEPKEARAASLKGKCRKMVPDSPSEPRGPLGDNGSPCARPLLEGKRSCLWHWLADQPIEVQTEWADQRRGIAERADHYVVLPRVPEDGWPAGHRWCSECQTMIPLFYCRGSRCVPHASRAAHASMTKRVYDFTREDYEALLAWQKGRCYICQQVPRSKRLAVDHDHATGAVRGLLCANDEWGCNMTLRRVLNDKGMARRLLDYVERHPLERMQAGEPPVTISGAPRAQAPPYRRDAPLARDDANDPFSGF